MKSILRTLSLLAAIAVLVLAAGRAVAQDEDIQSRSQIKVKTTQVAGGVVFVDILVGTKKSELQCNDGQPTCKSLKAGSYWMVVLPKNFGMYDCQNVEIYPGDKTPGEKDNLDPADRIGAYCQIEK